jgi:hypothetical protein
VIVCHDPDNLTRVLTVEELATRAPRLFDFLEPLLPRLASRSPYQELQPTLERPWGIQGPWLHLRRGASLAVARYIFTGGTPPAAVSLPERDLRIGMTTVVYPNNKTNFVATESDEEAFYICAFVNSTAAQQAISRFVSSTTIPPAALQRLPIPKFDPANERHVALAALGRRFTGSPANADADALDAAVSAVVDA